MNPKQTHRILVVSLVLIILMSIAGLYFANKRLTSLANNTAKLNAKAEIDKEKLQAYRQTKLKVESLSYVDQLADKVLPADAEQSTVVAEISQFAARSGVAVDSVNFESNLKSAPVAANKGSKKAAIPAGVTTIPISIKLSNGVEYSNLLNFLQSIENNRRKSQITSIELSPDLANRSRLNQVRIVLNVYARKVIKK